MEATHEGSSSPVSIKKPLRDSLPIYFDIVRSKHFTDIYLCIFSLFRVILCGFITMRPHKFVWNNTNSPDRTKKQHYNL